MDATDRIAIHFCITIPRILDKMWHPCRQKSENFVCPRNVDECSTPFILVSTVIRQTLQYRIDVVIFMQIPVFVILDEADRRSLRHSDWFKLKMIMVFSFNKLFPRIPPLPPKTQFIKIKFVNQGLDLLNISNIFRDHRVTSKIPQSFENLDPPLICYQYKSPIRNIIFNYNQVTSV